jgi:hypothetical protein
MYGKQREELMKSLIAFIACSLLLVGCIGNTPYTPPTECVNAESMILEKFPDPRTLDKGLLMVQVAALKSVDGYDKARALEVLDDLEAFVATTDSLTYATLMNKILGVVSGANSDADMLLFIIGPNIGQFDSPERIFPCDKVLIAQEFARNVFW